MTAPSWIDHSLPLAERVAAMIRMVADRDPVSDYDIDELLADIAAADRLARATSAWYRAVDTILPDGVYGGAAEESEMDKAEAAYRARMAQGVTHGA